MHFTSPRSCGIEDPKLSTVAILSSSMPKKTFALFVLTLLNVSSRLFSSFILVF
uniref:Uncharacterized protein n=1 Tax=Physcomitrium patens TaxID=3218 RepID=A0A2K1JW36_PHYPA|nr:hypothetical protein PHYPA_015511 [Physcomitrium patens]